MRWAGKRTRNLIIRGANDLLAALNHFSEWQVHELFVLVVFDLKATREEVLHGAVQVEALLEQRMVSVGVELRRGGGGGKSELFN